MVLQFFHALFFLLLKEKRERFPRRIVVLGEMLSMAFTLTVYWYTGVAFGSGGMNRFLEGGFPDYFHYIIWNDIALSLPLVVLSGTHIAIRDSHAQGALETFLTLPISRWRLVLMLQAPYLFQTLGRSLLTLGVAALLFDFKCSVLGWLGIFLLQLIAIPLFHGIGLLYAGFFLSYGRGEGLLSLFQSLGALIGGAYFPPTLFPRWVQEVAAIISPFNLLLDQSRAIYSRGLAPLLTSATLQLLGAGLLLIPIAYFFFQWGLNRVCRRGSIDFY